jgi:hypothetical protein
MVQATIGISDIRGSSSSTKCIVVREYGVSVAKAASEETVANGQKIVNRNRFSLTVESSRTKPSASTDRSWRKGAVLRRDFPHEPGFADHEFLL